MKTLFFPLVAALLLLPSCHHHGNNGAPTRCCGQPVQKKCCPQVAPKRCCPKAKSRYHHPQACPRRCRTQQFFIKTSPNRRLVSLQNLLDYLPGTPPSYLSI